MLESDTEFMTYYVPEVDNALFSGNLKYETVLQYFNVNQSDKWCERIYNEDAEYKYVVPYSKWIVFGIFLLLGLKFIVESFQPKEKEVQCIGLKCLLGLGLATSIDALVSGASIRLTQTSLLISVMIIGIASFLMSIGGFYSGNFIKNIPSKYLEITGGLILVALAFKSLF